MLTENKFKKYLIYALGEIILVTIGILIALQVNNRNQKSILVLKEILILKEISNNLKKDLEDQIVPCIKYYAASAEAFDFLQLNFYKSTKKISDQSIRSSFFKTQLPWYLNLKTVGFDNLNSIGVDLISTDTLRQNISSLYGYEYQALIKYQTYTETWFRNDILPLMLDNVDLFNTLTASGLSFLKNDIRLITRLKASIGRNRNFRNDLLKFMPKSEQLIIDIENEIKHLERN